MAKRGRKPKPLGDLKQSTASVRLTNEMRLILEEYAKKDGVSLSEEIAARLLFSLIESRRQPNCDLPHIEIHKISEHETIRMVRGGKLPIALRSSGLRLARSPGGEKMLTLAVGERGRINFVLPRDMVGQLKEDLRKMAS